MLEEVTLQIENNAEMEKRIIMIWSFVKMLDVSCSILSLIVL